MHYDFETIADSIDYGFGVDWREDYTMMAGAQLHVKTAPCIINALTGLVQKGLYGWTPSDGEDYLNAVSNWMRDVRKWQIKNEWIVPSYGILQAMCACMRAFTEPGDRVLVQEPVYLLYARAIERCGRVLVNNPLRYDGAGAYSMDFEDLENRMRDPRVKLMLLCSPHNPTMDAWDREDLSRVARLARENGVLVVADEIYAEQVIGDAEDVPYGSLEDAVDNCVICTSIGKAFNFTGTSHANIIIPNRELRERYITQRNADHYGSLSPFMRTAVLAAYTNEGKDWIDALMQFTAGNERILRDFIARVFPSVRVCRHRAGTLLWADFRSVGTEEEIEELFLAAGVEPDLGSKYGEAGRGFLRLQFGMPVRELQGALNRLEAEYAKRSAVHA